MDVRVWVSWRAMTTETPRRPGGDQDPTAYDGEDGPHDQPGSELGMSGGVERGALQGGERGSHFHDRTDDRVHGALHGRCASAAERHAVLRADGSRAAHPWAQDTYARA